MAAASHWETRAASAHDIPGQSDRPKNPHAGRVSCESLVSPCTDPRQQTLRQCFALSQGRPNHRVLLSRRLWLDGHLTTQSGCQEQGLADERSLCGARRDGEQGAADMGSELVHRIELRHALEDADEAVRGSF